MYFPLHVKTSEENSVVLPDRISFKVFFSASCIAHSVCYRNEFYGVCICQLYESPCMIDSYLPNHPILFGKFLTFALIDSSPVIVFIRYLHFSVPNVNVTIVD